MTDAFDADALIYAAAPDHPLGRRVRALFTAAPDAIAGIGSVLLVPEVLAKPIRDGATREVDALVALLSRLELRALDSATAEIATSLAVAYRLRAPDAIHLATAVVAGAERFVTDNSRDFPTTISEVDVTYPATLTEG